MGQSGAGALRCFYGFERGRAGGDIGIEEDDGVDVLQFGGDLRGELMDAKHVHIVEQIGEVMGYAVVGPQGVADGNDERGHVRFVQCDRARVRLYRGVR